ncbi:hypothetical protein EG19_06335 [Thermoanaerobaculum aquaticum]|uniref:Cardiolipin synthase N-terminal domain-containing protein n=1 Tax=Thermoanaerobaculum aquaticum TaxID=1312852 RepID=A0A062XVG5_9BACT|nr:hypothetical protein [Thermoanaerobaculum aquaticum]KDA53364.1 hypothetical protein EG19_06335 [Thermoanaerobaculum aquaticum]GBC79131.1 hypothetical protein HRbin09_00345 [bacterium HR09]
MSKGKAIVLAVFTLWPFLYMFLFFATIVILITSAAAKPQPSQDMPLLFGGIFIMHIATMLEIMGLLVVYIVHLFKTDRVPQDQKALWAVVIFLGNVLAMPVYWYLYIWKPLRVAAES